VLISASTSGVLPFPPTPMFPTTMTGIDASLDANKPVRNKKRLVEDSNQNTKVSGNKHHTHLALEYQALISFVVMLFILCH
jgi:hypothetical protein